MKSLTTQEIQQRRLQYGYNVVEEKITSRWIAFLKKFWASVPWMLEVTIILELFLGKIDECIIITALLFFNSILSYFQENRANNALALLKQRLEIQARVFRDSSWQLISAKELVPGDIVHLRMGDLSPADIRITEGKVLIDQSILTGEALPVECEVASISYSGAMIKRGEATGEVIATGNNTFFGKTAELIQRAQSESHVSQVVFTIVKYLVTIDVILVLVVLAYSTIVKLPITDVAPYILILLVASIPIALPATFTLSTAFGALQLAKQGVLITHLWAIEDAATMDIVCCDKTGTITQNQLSVTSLKTFSSYTDDELLYYAALASDDATQDPLDKAILLAAHARNLLDTMPKRMNFVPFDPVYKRAEASYNINNKTVNVIKGAPITIEGLLKNPQNLSGEINKMAEKGYRVLAVAISSENAAKNNTFDLVGFVALSDPPRNDSKMLIDALKNLVYA